VGRHHSSAGPSFILPPPPIARSWAASSYHPGCRFSTPRRVLYVRKSHWREKSVPQQKGCVRRTPRMSPKKLPRRLKFLFPPPHNLGFFVEKTFSNKGASQGEYKLSKKGPKNRGPSKPLKMPPIYLGGEPPLLLKLGKMLYRKRILATIYATEEK